MLFCIIRFILSSHELTKSCIDMTDAELRRYIGAHKDQNTNRLHLANNIFIRVLGCAPSRLHKVNKIFL